MVPVKLIMRELHKDYVARCLANRQLTVHTISQQMFGWMDILPTAANIVIFTEALKRVYGNIIQQLNSIFTVLCFNLFTWKFNITALNSTSYSLVIGWLNLKNSSWIWSWPLSWNVHQRVKEKVPGFECKAKQHHQELPTIWV